MAEYAQKAVKLESGYTEIDSSFNVTTGREKREPRTQNPEPRRGFKLRW